MEGKRLLFLFFLNATCSSQSAPDRNLDAKTPDVKNPDGKKPVAAKEMKCNYRPPHPDLKSRKRSRNGWHIMISAVNIERNLSRKL